MESVLTSDIFFFITAVSVVFITILVAVMIVMIIKILGRVQAILARIQEGTDAVAADLHDVRAKLKSKGIFSALFVALMSMASRHAASQNTVEESKKKGS